MRLFILLLVLISSVIQADELEKAYQKEYAYLVAEKKALEERLATVKKTNSQKLSSVSREIDTLQSNFLQKKNSIDRLNAQIVEAGRNADFSDNDQLLLETTLLQAKEALKKNSLELDDQLTNVQQLEKAFSHGNSILGADGKMTRTDGEYFAADGKTTEGTIISVGRIAKYATSNDSNINTSGALAPAGNHMFKLWNTTSATDALALADNKNIDSVNIFLFDNAEKAIDQKKEKGISDDIEAGGLIGKVIIAIGIAGAALVILRAIFLVLFSANIKKITVKVNDKIENGSIEDGLKYCKKNISSASRVISATLRNLDKDRDHIEDIISESILHESSRIDRFGAFILVIAAVSPLLGLLGTVTGMIGTFDIITEFGTGDPKLLSTGISEALVTTKFGLVVAIPVLLAGNALSSWATRIKNDLERAALHVINTHKLSANTATS